MKKFFIALQYLTILPVRIKSECSSSDFSGSLLYFPIVGFLIGGLLSAFKFLLPFIHSQVIAIIILIASAILTGALHLDGFCDTCDGIFSGKSKEKILEIMKDSHVGAMGVIGITLLFALKYVILQNINIESFEKVLITSTTFSRMVQVFACTISKYPKTDGKGKNFIGKKSKNEFLISMIITVCIIVVLMQVKGIIIFSVSFLLVMPVYLFIKKKIGGMTGDTIGAMNESAEVILLFVAMVFIKIDIIFKLL